MLDILDNLALKSKHRKHKKNKIKKKGKKTQDNELSTASSEENSVTENSNEVVSTRDFLPKKSLSNLLARMDNILTESELDELKKCKLGVNMEPHTNKKFKSNSNFISEPCDSHDVHKSQQEAAESDNTLTDVSTLKKSKKKTKLPKESSDISKKCEADNSHKVVHRSLNDNDELNVTLDNYKRSDILYSELIENDLSPPEIRKKKKKKKHKSQSFNVASNDEQIYELKRSDSFSISDNSDGYNDFTNKPELTTNSNNKKEKKYSKTKIVESSRKMDKNYSYNAVINDDDLDEVHDSKMNFNLIDNDISAIVKSKDSNKSKKREKYTYLPKKDHLLSPTIDKFEAEIESISSDKLKCDCTNSRSEYQCNKIHEKDFSEATLNETHIKIENLENEHKSFDGPTSSSESMDLENTIEVTRKNRKWEKQLSKHTSNISQQLEDSTKSISSDELFSDNCNSNNIDNSEYNNRKRKFIEVDIQNQSSYSKKEKRKKKDKSQSVDVEGYKNVEKLPKKNITGDEKLDIMKNNKMIVELLETDVHELGLEDISTKTSQCDININKSKSHCNELMEKKEVLINRKVKDYDEQKNFKNEEKKVIENFAECEEWQKKEKVIDLIKQSVPINEIEELLDMVQINVNEQAKNLEIVNPWLISPIHQIATRTRAPPTAKQRAQLKNAGITLKVGKYTKEEDEKIIDNWKLFCKHHDWDENQCQPFINGSRKSQNGVLNKTQFLNFVQFISHDIEDRLMYNIYNRFQRLFSINEKGNFTETDDKIILEYLKTGKSDKPFADLAVLLNRSSLALLKRYQLIQANTINDNKIIWNKTLANELIHTLLEVTGASDALELKNRHIQKVEWKLVSEKMNIPPKKLKRAWTINFLPRILAPNYSSEIPELRKKLVDLVIKKYSDWREIDWHWISKKINNGFPGQKLYTILHNLVSFKVPRSERKQLPMAMNYLKKYLEDEQRKEKTRNRLKYVNEIVKRSLKIPTKI